jgi:molybdopterin-guanine dinucleotide biosynthesis protein A
MISVILAGSKNIRISMTKALIKIGQQTIIEDTVNLFRHLFDEIIIVTNRFEDYQHLGI